MVDPRTPPRPPQPPQPSQSSPRPAPAAPKPAEASKPATAPAGHMSEQQKREQEKREQEKRGGHIDNRDQDPNNPANITQPRDVRPGAERDRIEGAVYSRENMMTEQEKDALKGQGSSAKEPYPTGNPPPPSESVRYGQGIKGVTDQPSAKPGTASGPAGKAPAIDDKNAADEALHKSPDKGSSGL